MEEKEGEKYQEFYRRYYASEHGKHIFCVEIVSWGMKEDYLFVSSLKFNFDANPNLKKIIKILINVN